MEFGEDIGGFSDFFKTFFGGGGFAGGGFGDDIGGGGPGAGSDVESVLEVDLLEVLKGGKRTLRLGERQVEVKVPPGVRDGSRLRVAGEGAAGRRGGTQGRPLPAGGAPAAPDASSGGATTSPPP